MKETTEKTRLALEKMLEGKIKAKMPKQAVQQTNDPTYIRYNPVQQGAGFNSGAQSRVIRMVEIAKDPMEPPKFRHKKVPRGVFAARFSFFFLSLFSSYFPSLSLSLSLPPRSSFPSRARDALAP